VYLGEPTITHPHVYISIKVQLDTHTKVQLNTHIRVQIRYVLHLHVLQMCCTFTHPHQRPLCTVLLFHIVGRSVGWQDTYTCGYREWSERGAQDHHRGRRRRDCARQGTHGHVCNSAYKRACICCEPTLIRDTTGHSVRYTSTSMHICIFDINIFTSSLSVFCLLCSFVAHTNICLGVLCKQTLSLTHTHNHENARTHARAHTHKHSHNYTHTRIRTHTHTHLRTHLHIHTSPHTHIYRHTLTHTQIHTHTRKRYTRIRTHMHRFIYVYRYEYIYTYIYTYTYIHICIYIYTYI